MISREQKEYLLPNAYNAALRAGAVIVDIYRGEAATSIELKKDMTPVTLADRTAHKTIREYLAHTRIPLLSEEGREMLYSERKNWDLFWMVDPLDGTKEFIRGNGEFTVNIALIVDNKPFFGVIYVPSKKRIYFADPDRGSFRRLHVEPDVCADYSYDDIFVNSQRLPLVRKGEPVMVVAVSRSHNNSETARLIDSFKGRYPHSTVIEQGSSYKLCLLAEGSVDYYPRTSPTYEWDTAAGEAILHMAEGCIQAVEGSPLHYNKESLLNPYFECFGSRLSRQTVPAVAKALAVLA